MGEYNWRKEREKYRPDFRKTPQEEQVVQTTVQTVIVQKPRSRFTAWLIIGLLIVLVVVGIILLVKAVGSSQGADASAMLAQAAEKNKKAVGLVVLTVVLQNGNKMPVPIGTAWAFEKDKFTTNAHVAKGLISTIAEIKQYFVSEMLKEIAAENGCKTPEELLKKIGKKMPNSWQRSVLQKSRK